MTLARFSTSICYATEREAIALRELPPAISNYCIHTAQLYLAFKSSRQNGPKFAMDGHSHNLKCVGELKILLLELKIIISVTKCLIKNTAKQIKLICSYSLGLEINYKNLQLNKFFQLKN